MKTVPCIVCGTEDSVHRCLRCGSFASPRWHVMPYFNHRSGYPMHRHYTLCTECHADSTRPALRSYLETALKT